MPAKEIALDGIVFDQVLAGTPYRGLIVKGEYCYCAYLGVPQGHWLAGLEDLDIPCHGGLNFAGPGDGVIRPADWFWYGWDYGHAFDSKFVPPEIAEILPESLQSFMKSGKVWTVAEIEQDLVDAAVYLLEQMQLIEAQIAAISGKIKHRP